MNKKRKRAVFLSQYDSEGRNFYIVGVNCFNLAPFGREAEILYRGTEEEAVIFSEGLEAAGWKVKGCFYKGDPKEMLQLTWVNAKE